MSIKIIFIFVIVAAYIVNDSSCGGGNHNTCWFYRSQFEQSLRTFSRVTNNWADHIISLMQTYSAQNPFSQSGALVGALDEIIDNRRGMFDTYLNNFAKEVANLTAIDAEVVGEAFRMNGFGTPFPLSCIPNLSNAGKVYDDALMKVNEEKLIIERTSHGIDD